MLFFVAPLSLPNSRASIIRNILRHQPIRPSSCAVPSDESFMRVALSQARIAASLGEVPIGAVLVSPSGDVLSTGHNLVESTHDATAHAELVCLRRAMASKKNWRMLETTLYSTLEPCPMCLSALALARVSKVVYAAPDLRLGACGTWIDLNRKDHPFHRFEAVVSGVLEDDAARLIKDFFRNRREEAKAAKVEVKQGGEEPKVPT